jgi:hypothetical protein
MVAFSRTCYSLSKLLASCLWRRLLSSAVAPKEECVVIRLIIAIVVGAVIAVGATVLVDNVLGSAANGTPSNSSLYQYGTR